MKQRGFTLIELLLGLIVSGLLASLAVPSFTSLLGSQQRLGAAQSLAQGLRYARAEAIARNRAVVIHALGDDWSLGWRVIVDISGRGHPDDDNPVLLERLEQCTQCAYDVSDAISAIYFTHSRDAKKSIGA